MTRALVLAERNFDSWRAAYLRGEAIAPLPYGIQALEQSGFQLSWAPRSEDAPWRKFRDVVEHRRSLLIERAVRGAPQAHKANLVVALLEQQGYAAALAKRRGIWPYAGRPLVLWSCWLADELHRGDAATRSRLLRRIEAADLITYFGPYGGDVLVDAGIDPTRTAELVWGVTHTFYTPARRERDIAVLAVGQDRGRDYRTLIDAFRGLPITLDLVCKPENISGLDLPRNVRYHGTVSMRRYRDMLQRAQVVAVPTIEMIYPTGSSVALEAAASGCAVAVTQTPGLSTYFDDGINGRLVPLLDTQAWRDVLMDLVQDPEGCLILGQQARRRVELVNNSDRMWDQFAGLVRQRGLV